MTLSELKKLVHTSGLPYQKAIVDWKTDFDTVYEAEKDWLCNLEDKLGQAKNVDSKERIQRVILKLKANKKTFDESDTADLSKFISSINTLVDAANRLNNFKQGTALSNGSKLDLPALFNHIKQTKLQSEFSFELNKNLQAFVPHLFSVIKHCQEPLLYPIYYKYWRNIMREVYRLPDGYDSMTQLYRTLPENQRHLHFAAYMGATGIQIARTLNAQGVSVKNDKGLSNYLETSVLNLPKYYQIIGTSSTPIRHYIIGSKYGDKANESIFEEMLAQSVVAVGFAKALNLSSYYGKQDSSLDKYLSDQGEKSNAKSALRKLLSMRPGDLIAVKADGAPKQSQGFLSIIGLAKVVEKKGQVYVHDPSGLGHTINVEFYKAPVYHAFELGGYGQTVHELSNGMHISTIFDFAYQIIDKKQTKVPKMALNTIFYGPPGTGKTYGALEHALTILGVNTEGKERKELKQLFDARLKTGEVVFTTFHQNMSYEDFIEGIKPQTVKKKVVYDVQDGIFKDLCNKARTSAGNFEAVIELFKKELSESELDVKKLVTIKAKATSFHVTYRGTGVFYVQPLNTSKKDKDPWYPVNIQHIRKVFATQSYDGVYNSTYVREIIQFLLKTRNLQHSKGQDAAPRVLIIDEINRGNVSQIFGELITLLEEDKREGCEEALEVVLPYSREKFSVPRNVYIIGTMNTADRSVEALDTALRRRFSFVELPPDPEVISKHGKLTATAGILEGIDLAKVLQTLNERMEVLLTADNKIGHSYFLKVHDRATLKDAFYKNIIPLLQEYFYGNPGKLGLVLGNGFVEMRFDESKAKVKFAAFDYEDPDALQRVVYNIVPPNENMDIIQAVKILMNEA